jgi:hypothetical protein
MWSRSDLWRFLRLVFSWLMHHDGHVHHVFIRRNGVVRQSLRFGWHAEL